MLHTNNPIIKHKAGLLNLAEEPGNVSKACKIMGVSRDTFYRYQELAEEGGIDALVNQNRRVPSLKNRTGEATERAVAEYAVEFPAHGQHRTSNQLRKKGVFISGSGVRSIWQRHDPENFRKRLRVPEEKAAKEGMVLTDAQIAAPEKKAHELTTDYYLFLFTSRENPKLTGYFTCGLYAAKGWFELNGQRPEEISSYNPLTGESSGGSKKSGCGITKPLKAESDPRMKRLIRVLQTFISLTDDEERKIKGESTTLTILHKLIKSSMNAPSTSNIRSVNTILYKALKDGRHGGAHTFTQLVDHYEVLLGVTFKKIVNNGLKVIHFSSSSTVQY